MYLPYLTNVDGLDNKVTRAVNMPKIKAAVRVLKAESTSVGDKRNGVKDIVRQLASITAGSRATSTSELNDELTKLAAQLCEMVSIAFKIPRFKMAGWLCLLARLAIP